MNPRPHKHLFRAKETRSGSLTHRWSTGLRRLSSFGDDCLLSTCCPVPFGGAGLVLAGPSVRLVRTSSQTFGLTTTCALGAKHVGLSSTSAFGSGLSPPVPLPFLPFGSVSILSSFQLHLASSPSMVASARSTPVSTACFGLVRGSAPWAGLTAIMLSSRLNLVGLGVRCPWS